MKNISVIGSGTMGNGIVHTFAQFGYNVSLIDISEEAVKKALSTINKNLSRMVSKEKITEEDKKSTLDRIITYNSIKDGIKDADLVVEAFGGTLAGEMVGEDMVDHLLDGCLAADMGDWVISI